MSLWDNESYTFKPEEQKKEIEEEHEEDNDDNDSSSSEMSEDEDIEDNQTRITLGDVFEENFDDDDDSEDTKNLKSKPQLKEMSLKRHTEEAERTVFIANVSVKAKSSEITKFLKQFGKLISYRLRTGAFKRDFSTKKEPSRKVKFLKKQYSEKRKTQHCYAVYSTPEEAEKAAIEINGKEFLGFHLRADWEVNKGKMRDIRNTIFVGNLPFVCEEEEVRKKFEKVGEIKRVKVVRNNITGLGTGVGYVTFVNREDVVKGLDMIGDRFKGRLLRIQPCHKNEQKRVERKKEWIEKKVALKKEKKRVYKETVKSTMGKKAKKEMESKPKKAKK